MDIRDAINEIERRFHREIKHTLDENHQPVLATNLFEWAAWLSNPKNLLVEQTTIGNVKVSTVFLGLDYNFSGVGPPILFETMIFGDDKYKFYQARYHTWDEAIEGHKYAVTRLKEQNNEQK